ncbi:flippase-like domain-containing protein [Candidatus Saccharibacteria bacterium]|nr:flippase-like domain-containing protein [Candidatus Saccharibacteria bacterium]
MAESQPTKEQQKKLQKKFFRRPLLIVLFILINVVVITVTATSEFGNSANAAELSEVKINWWLLIPAALCFAVALMLEIGKYTLMMKELSRDKKEFDIKHARKIARRTVILGKYYDNITPAAVGGQPFQIYYMHKNGNLPSGLATTIPIIGMISGQIGFIAIAVLCFLFGSLSIDNAALIATACFGLIFYSFWPIVVMLATFLPKAMAEFIKAGVKLLAKMHIVKDREKAIQKTEYEVNEYAESVKLILKTKGLFAKTIAMSVGFNILVAMIPFFVLTAFGGEVDFLPCFVTTVAITSAVYFVPTPGNSGAAEGTFYVVFSALSEGYVFWAMLVWRFFSYYIYIIMGPLTYYKIHLENRKIRKQNEKITEKSQKA